jgi:HK97 family phage portal protein
VTDLERRIWGSEREPEQRDAWSESFQVPPWPSYFSSAAGPFVTLETAAGLPTVAVCIRLLAETTGVVPCEVFRGIAPNISKAENSWQWYRLHEQPNDEQAPYEFFRDIETAITTTGNAFVWKAKARPIPTSEDDIELHVLDSTRVTIRRSGGRKEFRIGNDPTWYSSQQIIHIRGWTVSPQQDVGLSPIALHRESLGGALAMDEFLQRFYSNGATLGGVIEVPDAITRDQARDLRDDFADRHGGLVNAHKPAVLYNGASYNQIGINPADAQYIQSKDWTVPEIARMFRISAVGLIAAALGRQPTSAADDLERFMKWDLPPRLAEIAGALKSDQDLFGPRTNLFPKFDPDVVIKTDMNMRANYYKAMVQAGILTADDARIAEGYPPHPNGLGAIPQITPVGGAPNPPPNDGSQSDAVPAA